MITFKRFAIVDHALVENVPHYYSRKSNSYIPEISDECLYDTRELAAEEAISEDDVIEEFIITITPAPVEHPTTTLTPVE